MTDPVAPYDHARPGIRAHPEDVVGRLAVAREDGRLGWIGGVRLHPETNNVTSFLGRDLNGAPWRTRSPRLVRLEDQDRVEAALSALEREYE